MIPHKPKNWTHEIETTADFVELLKRLAEGSSFELTTRSIEHPNDAAIPCIGRVHSIAAPGGDPDNCEFALSLAVEDPTGAMSHAKGYLSALPKDGELHKGKFVVDPWSEPDKNHDEPIEPGAYFCSTIVDRFELEQAARQQKPVKFTLWPQAALRSLDHVGVSMMIECIEDVGGSTGTLIVSATLQMQDGTPLSAQGRVLTHNSDCLTYFGHFIVRKV